jgi:hypothetical protein
MAKVSFTDLVNEALEPPGSIILIILIGLVAYQVGFFRGYDSGRAFVDQDLEDATVCRYELVEAPNKSLHAVYNPGCKDYLPPSVFK